MNFVICRRFWVVAWIFTGQRRYRIELEDNLKHKYDALIQMTAGFEDDSTQILDTDFNNRSYRLGLGETVSLSRMISSD